METAYSPRMLRTLFSLNQAAAPYTLWTATGEVRIENMSIYCTAQALAPLTAVEIATNQAAPYIFMSSMEGAVGNLVAQYNVSRTEPSIGIKPILENGQLILATIGGGASAAGSLIIAVEWRPLASGAKLS